MRPARMRHARWMVAGLLATVALALAGCQTATVLQDGRVLLVTAAGAALYDPVAGTITATGAPTDLRIASSSTLLDDGTVLFAGGATDGGSLASVERYDPAAGAFAAAGTLAEPRALHAAQLLQDGRVLITGGGVLDQGDGEASPPPLTTAEIYDPATGTSTPTGSMGEPRAMHVSTLLADGTVLLTGGNGGDAVISAAERFDPATGTFSATGALATARALHTATLLEDGSVLIIGGLQQGDDPDADPILLDSIERYDPTTGTFTAIGTLGTLRGGHTATLLADGQVLVAGGIDPSGNGIASAELVDPATGTPTPTGSMTMARGLHSAALLASGEVLIVGGELDQVSVEGADPLGTPERYDPATGTFQVVER